MADTTLQRRLAELRRCGGALGGGLGLVVHGRFPPRSRDLGPDGDMAQATGGDVKLSNHSEPRSALSPTQSHLALVPHS